MRARCDALDLPLVLGHGDLKPSNVMHDATAQPPISFIDFELCGMNYRGYDLFKLFRTSADMSTANLRSFLAAYLEESAALSRDGPPDAAATDAPSPSLAELEAESYAAEPLTWLEVRGVGRSDEPVRPPLRPSMTGSYSPWQAAVFFLFAVSVYPEQAPKWAPLATQRWEAYLESAGAIDSDGHVTRALQDARAAKRDARSPRLS